MAAPIISTSSSPVAVGNQVLVTGVNFGFVSSCALVETTTNAVIDCPDFIVDSGFSVHLTVPRSTPEGIYEVLLGTLAGEHSTNIGGNVTVVLAPVPFPPDPVPPVLGTTPEMVRTRLRYELGDYVETFSASIDGDGVARRFELPAEAVNSTDLDLTITDEDNQNPQTLAEGDYVLEGKQGVVTLTAPLPVGKKLYVQGSHGQFFSDEELDMFIGSALLKHTHNATRRIPYRDPVTGRTRYIVDSQSLTNLDPVEAHPLAIMAATEALWVIAADASYDIDVVTAEGTSLPRQQRYRAVMQMIEAQEQRYTDLANKLGVGLGRLEMYTLRRISRQTGRLVPVYQDREYDDNAPPMRLYPPIDSGLTGSGSMQRAYIGQQYPPEQP